MKRILPVVATYFLLLLYFSSPIYAQFCDAAGNPSTDPATGHVSTAIGCLPLDRQQLITVLLNWAVGLSGGIALILIIVAAVLMIASQGDPKRVQAGRELLTAAIMGLVVISLSVVLLNFLGVNILGLSGLGFNL